MADTTLIKDDELDMLDLIREEGYNYQERRHAEWEENYQLYRMKVIVNRLTQRQSVNIPLMKQHIRTLLKDVDDMPILYFENLDNNKDAEIFKNEYWKYTVEQNKMELADIVDKKQVFLFGRSFDQWQIMDGKVKMTIQDPLDIKVAKGTDPTNIHSSRFLVHENIYVPLSDLEANEDYDQEKIAELKKWYSSQDGLIKAQDNLRAFEEKQKRLADLGMIDAYEPVLGETYVELRMYFIFRHDEKWKDKEGREQTATGKQIMHYVSAENLKVLMKKPLEKIYGVTKDHFWQSHYPYNSWADDVERTDFWSDAIADIVRVPNVVVNSWFSQLVENRTLKNFNMHYYNSNLEGFAPQSWNPVAWGWYGIPVPPNGRLEDVIQDVKVADLSDSLDELNFVIGVAERATGATATQQGAPTEKRITLGEVELTLAEAKERIKGMSKFYTPAWKDRGLMFIKLVEGSPEKLDAVKVYKKGRNTDNIYSREIAPGDWQTESGYQCKVWSQDEKDANDVNILQKQNAVKNAMPNNPKVADIYNRKLLEWAGYNPDEINDIMKWEEEQRQALMATLAAQAGMMGGQPPAGGQPGMTPGGPPAPRPALQA